MRILVSLLIALLAHFGVHAQKIQWESTRHDYGTVRDWDSPPATFRLTNTGKAKLMFLPRHYGRDVQVILPNRSLAPGETAEVTIHYYTPDTGPFSKTVEVWSNASDRPQTLTIRGNIASLRNNALTACPTFQSEMPAQSSGVNTITVVDRSTGEQIAGARVELFKKRQSRAVYTSDQRGLVRSRLENGEYTVQAEMSGYYPTVQDIAFERRQGTVIVFMEPMRTAVVRGNEGSRMENRTSEEDLGLNVNEQWQEAPTVDGSGPSPADKTNSTPTDKHSLVDLGLNINDQWGEVPVTDMNVHPSTSEENGESKMDNTTDVEDLGLNTNDQWEETPAIAQTDPTPDAAEADPIPSYDEQLWSEVEVEAALAASTPRPEFSEEEFRPNNIVLLLDVSSSMRKDGKLELLKSSAARMVNMMREVDHLTVMAFNVTVWTVVSPTPVTDHSSIIANIDELVAEGYTSGVKGMKEAYAQLGQTWVEGGNNQLILVTDGMFTSSSFTEKDATDMAADNAKKGIILSVVGFQNEEDGGKMMKRIARRGNGSYLQIDGADDPVGVLAEEIKMRSRRL